MLWDDARYVQRQISKWLATKPFLMLCHCEINQHVMFNLFMYKRWSIVLCLTVYLAGEVKSHVLRTAQSARRAETISAPQFQEVLHRFGHSGSNAWGSTLLLFRQTTVPLLQKQKGGGLCHLSLLKIRFGVAQFFANISTASWKRRCVPDRTVDL